MRTLGVFTGGIGDMLLAGPAFAHLHEQGPLDLAGNPERLALIKAAGACQSIYDLDRIDFHTAFDKPSPKLRELMRQYDRIIIWMRDDGAVREALLSCGVRDVQLFPGIPPDAWYGHASEYYQSCVCKSARREPRPPIRINWEGETPAEPQHDVLIHSGSGSPKKNWPIENFVSVASALERADRTVAWLRGPAEDGIESPGDARIVESATLVDLAKTLANANLYIGNDSGITHLAAAVGCRTAAVFGPTAAAVWAPRGDNVRVVSSLPWPSVDAVLGVLNAH